MITTIVLIFVFFGMVFGSRSVDTSDIKIGMVIIIGDLLGFAWGYYWGGIL